MSETVPAPPTRLRSLRELKRETRRRFPQGHPFREAVLRFEDEVDLDDAEAAALLRVLIRLLSVDERPVRSSLREAAKDG
jgi:hypothetical protein